VRVPRRVFQILLPQASTPERCLEAYYLQRNTARTHRRAGGIALADWTNFIS